MSRRRLDRPFTAEHARSVERRMDQRKPRNLAEYLAWFREGFLGDIPSQLHVAGVWREWVPADGGGTPGGGSLLGTPRTAEAFRRYIEGHPKETVVPEYESHKAPHDEVYARPMQAALHELAGWRGFLGDHRKLPTRSFMARFLFAVALCDFDWKAVSLRWGMAPPQVAEVFTEAALYSLWAVYRDGPPVRVLSEDGNAA